LKVILAIKKKTEFYCIENRGVFFLTFLLGITWVFGFLLFSDLIVFAFIFTIANGLQGVVIFIERCILNKKIRNEIIANLKRFPTYPVLLINV